MAGDDASAYADDEDDIEELAAETAEEEALGVSRKQDLSKRAGVRKALIRAFDEIDAGYRDQWNRSNDQQDYWDTYNCTLSSKQFYVGNSKIYVPVVHNAVNARKTRFTNQIFPQAGRYVEVTSSDGTRPDAISSLLEYYVRKAKLRTKVMPALCKAGDIEGQYNVYIGWCERKRHVTWRAPVQPELMQGMPNPAAAPIMDIRHETIEVGYPAVEVLADCDVLVLPVTADDIEDALDEGGSVTVIRRWGKEKLKRMIADGAIRKDEGEALIDQMSKKSPPEVVHQAKHMADAAGIKGEGGKKFALVYETFLRLEVKGEDLLCQAFFGGDERVLGCRRNPLWCDKIPIISAPVEKVGSSFKGRSKIADCADMQYAANDAVNLAWDSAGYSLLPIVMTDPERNPRVGTMVMSMAAVWETSPKDTQVVNFPQLWKDGFAMVNECKQEVSQTLAVSPAAITQGTSAAGKTRQNQAQVAQEQQIDILTTADAVTVMEEGILTPMIEMMVELDHQYRNADVTVRAFGEMGLRAEMEKIPPIQMDKRYQFRWFGVEQARGAQQIQQQIAAMNVIRGIPPQQLNGYQVNMVPVITQLVENTFGPRLAPLVFVSPEQQLPVPVEQENFLLREGFEVPTHQMDDDQQHVMAHGMLMQQLQVTGSGAGAVKKVQTHIWKHMQQMQGKQQAQMQQQGGQPGAPGGAIGGQAQPGVPGQPRPGAQPGLPRPQGPPGMIPRDQMQDPRAMQKVA
jgi:hypothetical protein